MFRRKATAPDGSTWKLGRKWFPRRRELGGLDGLDPTGLPFPNVFDALDDFLGAILVVVFAALAAVFLALVLFNVVVLAIEITIIVLGVIVGLFSRVVLRKPWTVFAKSGPHLVERQVVGWRGSRRLIDELAGEVESGGLQRALEHG